jgi:hypothetical protein
VHAAVTATRAVISLPAASPKGSRLAVAALRVDPSAQRRRAGTRERLGGSAPKATGAAASATARKLMRWTFTMRIPRRRWSLDMTDAPDRLGFLGINTAARPAAEEHGQTRPEVRRAIAAAARL